MRPGLDCRQRGIAIVIELGTQLRHAIHVDAQAARHTQQLRQLGIELFERQLARLPLVAAGVEDAAAFRQAKAAALGTQGIHDMNQAEACAQQRKGLAAAL